MADIESLELQITSDAKGAKDGLDALITTLDTLKTKTNGGCGLSAIAKPLGKITAEAGKLKRLRHRFGRCRRIRLRDARKIGRRTYALG